MIKAAAVITLMIALAAAGDLAYQATVLRPKYQEAALACANCTTVKDAAQANWRQIESNIELLKAQKKNREAEKLAHDHANEKPLDIDIPCSDCEIPAPDYTRPGTVAVLASIASAMLFGAVKAKKY
ncbi:MAG: hypothetical protein WBQ43_10200 [Terriglobales bacterium]